MLAGPEHPDLSDLTNFGSREALEEVLLTEGVQRWEHWFGQPANTCGQRWWQSPVPNTGIPLLPGDADQDHDFDQLDLVQVQIAAKYLTGERADWCEGDWNSGPGGTAGNPPQGDGLFNQLDIIAALNMGTYMASAGYYADGTPSHSETNTQVTGVDEGDLVETDGEYLYTLFGQQLVIADSWPVEELAVVSRVDLPGQPFAQYLHADRLTVISQGAAEFDTNNPIIARPFQTFLDELSPDIRPGLNVTVLDVSNRRDPRIVQQTAMHGSYVDSRAIGETVYLATSDRFGLPAPEVQCTSPEDAGGVAVRCRYETKEQYLTRVEPRVLELGLPHFSAFGPTGELMRQGLYGEYSTTYEPTTANHERLLSVVVFDVSSDLPGPASFTNVPTSDATIMYASTENLYLMDPDWGGDAWEPNGQATSVVRFDLDSSHGQVVLGAAGVVPGRVLNSFSVDEYDGRFRIATTERSGRNVTNGVYILEQVEGELPVVGQTTELAPDEEIFAVRFMEDRGYVVTFPTRRLFRDPLFTLDLSDPHDPKVLGELEIPGFSNYLHPVQDGYLIGLGRDADERTGRTRGLQLSLFDVSDPARPILAQRFDFDVPAWAQTEAIDDHHALAYFPEHGVLTIPVTSGFRRQYFDRDGDGRTDLETARPTTDLWVFHIDPAARTDGNAQTQAVELLGRIRHDADIRRSVRIEDLLYSLSDTSVYVHNLIDPDDLLSRLYLGQDHVGIPVYHADDEAPVAPQVTEVRVANSDWAPGFINHLDRDMPGSVDVEPPEVVPFVGIDQIKITFSEDVLVGRQDLKVQGAGPSTYPVTDFVYVPDSATAVWTLAEPVEADLVRLTLADVVDLDGNRLEGNGVGQTGGTFSHQFRLLAGDLNQDGTVDYGDVGRARDLETTHLNEAAYDLFTDTDGNGITDEYDTAAIQLRWGNVLPGIESPVLGDTNGDGRFDQLDLVQVLQGGKFLTREPASPSQGDWNADGAFDQLDLVIALQEGHYRHGPAAAVTAADAVFEKLAGNGFRGD